MHTLTIPFSGQLLVAHLAAYGLGFLLDRDEQDAFICHHPHSLEMEPQVVTHATVEHATGLIRHAAAECERIVEADLPAGLTKVDRPPVIWARATNPDRAEAALSKREELLDEAERDGAKVAAGLVAGLGAPATWSKEKPQRGASPLDGVTGNSTSDFVRGVLRNTRPVAAEAQADELATAWTDLSMRVACDDEDKTGWSPRGTQVDPVHQWLAALGLSQLPVAQVGYGWARTPCCRRDGQAATITLPVFEAPVSVPRLRSLLQLPELCHQVVQLAAPAKARLRALGIGELVTFTPVRGTSTQSIAFRFARGVRTEL